jgi:hypothetical protein
MKCDLCKEPTVDVASINFVAPWSRTTTPAMRWFGRVLCLRTCPRCQRSFRDFFSRGYCVRIGFRLRLKDSYAARCVIHDAIQVRWSEIPLFLFTTLSDFCESLGRAPKFLRSLNLRRFLKKLPDRLELFALVLPRKVRGEAFEPFVEEIKEDLVRALAKNRKSRIACYWIAFCAIFRAALATLESFRLLLTGKAFDLVLKLLPIEVRKWWKSQ